MDLLLVAFHASFFAPVVLRMARRLEGAPSEAPGALAEIADAVQTPALVLHGSGLLLLWLGVAYALAQGEVARAVTARGLLGAGLLLAATVLMMWSFSALRSWRLLPTVDPGHELCTTGPYGLVRHPMYLAVDLLGIGSAVWVGTSPVLIAAVLLVAGGDLRARREERALVTAFGERYRSYRGRVRRIVPFVY